MTKTKKTKKKPDQKPDQKPKLTPEQRQVEKVIRLAHHIFTKTIVPANLKLEEVIDVLTTVAKAVVLSSTPDDAPEDRSGMVAWFEERFVGGMAAIDPLAERPRVWFVPPQGLITEPVGILWSGAHDDDDDDDDDDEEAGQAVQVVLGAELESLRAEIVDDPTAVIVTEGVEGIAIIDPAWDGAPTVTCANPQCGKVHDVHLSVAENLFEQAVEQRRRAAPPN